MKAENPYTRDYWLGEVDPRPLALFRILFGSVVLFDLLERLPELTFWFSDEGLAPRQAIPMLARTWSLFRLVGSPGATAALYWLGIAAVLALILGFGTRAASVATFVFLASLHSRNPFLTAGPDRVIAVMAFWMMFADVGGAWSADRWMGRRSGATVASAGLRFLQWQMCLIYFFAAIAKRKAWGGGLGIYHIMQIPEFATRAGALLPRWPSLSIALNWLVLATELGVPLLLIPLAPLAPKWTRAAALAASLGLFVGIILTVHVGCFPELMIAALALFIPPEWLDRIGAVDRTPVADPRPVSMPRRWALLGAGGLQLALVAWLLLALHFGLPMGRFVKGELRQANLFQVWKMFAQREIPISSWWSDSGVLENGDRIEVLADVAPAIISRETPESHWETIRIGMTAPQARRERVLLARYVCRTFNRSAPVPLRELELTLHERPVHDPGRPEAEERIGKVYRMFCSQAEEIDPGPAPQEL